VLGLSALYSSYNDIPVNKIARLNSNGSLDDSFEIGSGANNFVYTIALQPDGKILIGGGFTSYKGTPRGRITRILVPTLYNGIEDSFLVNFGSSRFFMDNNKVSFSGNSVGINVDNPSSTLEIRETTADTLGSALNVTDFNHKSLLSVRNDGNIGIGTTNAQSKLAVSGLTESTGTNLVIDADGNIFKASSSERYKEDIQSFSTDFEKILEVDPKSFKYKATGASDIGYLAEDFDALGLYDLVIYDAEGRPDAIKYDRITLYLLEVVKGLVNKETETSSLNTTSSSELDLLRQEIENLKLEMNLGKSDALTASQSAILDSLTVTDLSVTGKIVSGLLTINGLDEKGEASISTLHGPLKLQVNALENIEMMDGKLIVDTSGNLTTLGEITAKKYNVSTGDVLAASIGEGIIPAASTSVVIQTTAVTENSKIFVTPEGTAIPMAIKTKITGESFTVFINEPALHEIKFNWWIVN
jgi:hypothetical protein